MRMRVCDVWVHLPVQGAVLHVKPLYAPCVPIALLAIPVCLLDSGGGHAARRDVPALTRMAVSGSMAVLDQCLLHRGLRKHTPF